LKNRTTAGTNNNLTDAVRGVNKQLYSNDDVAEQTDSTIMTAFGADGFTVGTSSDINGSTNNIVSWNWKGDGVSGGTLNEDGTENTQVNVNTTSGFSIVTYTGTGVVDTFGHGLSQAPELILGKELSNSGRDWFVYSEPAGNTKFLELNTENAEATDTTTWNSATPTASVFSLGVGSSTNSNDVSQEYVAYCFHSVEGYSKIGSYIPADVTSYPAPGSFVYCGFRPKYLLTKNITGSSGTWYINDGVRNPYNMVNRHLTAAGAGAEGTDSSMDFLSNGFKEYGQWGYNYEGDTILYIAFAESPFKTANAR